MFTKKLIEQHVLGLLGDNSISVELATEDWNIIHTDAVLAYNKYRPKVIQVPFTIQQNKQDYQLNPITVGRGIFHIPWKNIVDIPDIFPNTYTPISTPGSPQIASTDYLRWRIDMDTTKEISGLQEDFEYNSDTARLRIYPVPLSSYATELHTMHDRYFDRIVLQNGNGTATYQGILGINNGLMYKNFTNILPFKFKILIGTQEIISDDGNGNLVGNNNATGTINYITGAYTITLTSTISTDKEIVLEVNELRPNDQKWYSDYCYSIACRIIGNKAKRFGSIPGSQGELALDVDKLQEGIEMQEKLEAIAYGWIHEWFIPRMQ